MKLWTSLQARTVHLESRNAGKGEEQNFHQPKLKGCDCAVQCWDGCSVAWPASLSVRPFQCLLWVGESLLTTTLGEKWAAEREAKSILPLGTRRAWVMQSVLGSVERIRAVSEHPPSPTGRSIPRAPLRVGTQFAGEDKADGSSSERLLWHVAIWITRSCSVFTVNDMSK